MLKVSKTAPDRLDIELAGALGEEAMREGLDTLIEAAEGIENGRMLYRIADFEMPTLGALAVEFQQMPKLFSLIGKFDKCAVLSDAAWIRTAAQIEGAVIPGLEIKSFAFSATEAAEEWLSGGAPADDSDEDENENFPV